jgi:hypothetical protein
MDTLRANLGEQDSLSSEKTSSSDQPIDDEKKCSGNQKRGSGCTTEAVRRECASGEHRPRGCVEGTEFIDSAFNETEVMANGNQHRTMGNPTSATPDCR